MLPPKLHRTTQNVITEFSKASSIETAFCIAGPRLEPYVIFSYHTAPTTSCGPLVVFNPLVFHTARVLGFEAYVI